LARLFDKHIDAPELEALVPSTSETGGGVPGLSPQDIREAERHVKSCVECSRKVSKYRQLIDRFWNAGVSEAGPRRADCPKDEDVDWHEVAAGLWPELKARQLILHAALCDHCGPLLRGATSLHPEPTPEEEKLLAELKVPSVPGPVTRIAQALQPRWRFTSWLVPALSIIVVTGVLGTIRPWSSTRLSGEKFVELAVKAHQQHVQGHLALGVRSDSQQTVNEWFKAKAPFALALPAAPAVPGEERPYRLEGAQLVPVGSKTAAYIAYEVQASPASLVIVPDSVAVASGGAEVDFTKVRFHYRMVEGYKVVTWSVHGLTYALVSQEGNDTQRSCMVCHSAMRDRNLSKTPTPLRPYINVMEPVKN